MQQFHIFYFKGHALLDGERIEEGDLLDVIDHAREKGRDTRVLIKSSSGWKGEMNARERAVHGY